MTKYEKRAQSYPSDLTDTQWDRNKASVQGNAEIHMAQTRIDGCSAVFCKDRMPMETFAA
jgi:hypothetical protein